MAERAKKRRSKELAPGLTKAEWDDWTQEMTLAIDVRARRLRDGRVVVRALLGPARDPALTVYDISDEGYTPTVTNALRKLADAADAGGEE